MKERLALLRGVAWVAMAGYVEAAVGLLAGVLIARTLGPTEYGHYAFAVWMCGALIMAVNNGLPTTAIKFIAETRGLGDEATTAALVHRFTRLQVVCSAAVLALFAVAISLSPVPGWRIAQPVMLGIAIVAVWSRAGFWMWGAIGKGHELFGPENIALALNALLNLALVLVLAWKGAATVEFFALYAVLGVAANLVLRGMLRRIGIRGEPGPIPEDLARRMRRHLILTAILILLVIGTNRGVEMFLLKIYAGPEAVGFFAIAGALTKGAVELLAGGMAAVLLPTMSRRFGQGGKAALSTILAESTRIYWFVGLAIAGIGFTASEDIIHLLYGHRYEGAIPALTWSLVIAGLIVVNGAAAAVLTASDRQADRIKIVLVAFVLGLIAGLALIPRYGLPGAIATLAASQVCETALAWFYAFRRVQVRLPVAPMSRQAIAALVSTALATWLTQSLGNLFAFLAGVALFLACYVTMCVLMRTARSSEYELVAHVVSKLGRPGARLSPRIVALSRFALRDPA